MVLFLWLECLPEQTEIKSADPDGRLAKLFDGLLRFETVDAADGSFLWFGRLFGRTEIKSAGPAVRLAKFLDGLLRFETVDAADGSFFMVYLWKTPGFARG